MPLLPRARSAHMPTCSTHQPETCCQNKLKSVQRKPKRNISDGILLGFCILGPFCAIVPELFLFILDRTPWWHRRPDTMCVIKVGSSAPSQILYQTFAVAARRFRCDGSLCGMIRSSPITSEIPLSCVSQHCQTIATPRCSSVQ